MQHSSSSPVHIWLENNEFPGVKRVARKVAEDFGKVSGTPAQISDLDALQGWDPALLAPALQKNYGAGPVVIAATLGLNDLIDQSAQAWGIDVAALQNREQAYEIKKVNDDLLVILGADKLGTIYGLYALAEYIGISPLHFWGDVQPQKRDIITISSDIDAITKTPSVKYRGFFINDEWPNLGTWAFHHFGGFNAEMYDHVFDLLLRLKGNYLWPAMWTASFPIDGPGAANEELADEYGITVGASHHEPLLRASEEWDLVRGADTPYGEDWNYITNKQGLLNYWRDAIKRSGHLNKMIMMGIRGERDSELLGPDATLAANVELLKGAITEQKKIIAEEAPGTNNPQMLALYKEVEEYYYGSDTVPGLKGWDGLEGVTLMFCEDNFGFMRSLPDTDKERAGAGIYYHLDYHGGPVSYEWMPSISFERIHDQMSLAYEYGIRDTWVVNVGDLKWNEVPLAFFMAMAYDMDKYGRGNPNAISEYTQNWVQETFPGAAPETQTKIGQVMHDFIRLNAMRRPEALNSEVYHAAHHHEADRILQLAEKIQKLDREIEAELSQGQNLAGYQSLIGIPARFSTNLVQMMVNAAKNEHYAKQGKPIANVYADLVSEAINTDHEITKEIREFAGGKWFGHEKEHHIGFTTWNDDGHRYPIRHLVQPVAEPRITVTRADQPKIHQKKWGGGNEVIVDDFIYAGNDCVLLEIANDGEGELQYSIDGGENIPWLDIAPQSGTVIGQQPIMITCKRELLPENGEIQTANLVINASPSGVPGYRSEAQIPVIVTARSLPVVSTGSTDGVPRGTFLPGPGHTIAIPAANFTDSHHTSSAQWAVVPLGGREGDAIRILPTTTPSFGDDLQAKRPTVTYKVLVSEPGEHTIEVWQVPTGVVVRGTALHFTLETAAGKQLVNAIPADVNAGYPHEPRWAQPVLDNIRKTAVTVELPEGLNEIKIGAVEPNLMLERVLIYPSQTPPPVSYLGPPDSITVG